MEESETLGSSSSSCSLLPAQIPQKSTGTKQLPICMIVLGMAGSGKTTFVRKFTQFNYSKYKPYVINLDPACREVPYPVNIDIRDTVNYREVMNQYKLGPNGAIVTSLNLFATKFEKVVELIEKSGQDGHKICIIDTPGQIEVFTWSASGTIITEALASAMPTIVIYVMDVVRSLSPTTFMSNMLYACSILYKTRLPFIVVMNKIDIQNHNFAIEWMRDFEAFEEALEKEQTYVSNLTRSMSLTLDEFYRDLKTCGVSSKLGIGFDILHGLIEKCAEEYQSDYKAEYDRLRAERMKNESKISENNRDGTSACGSGIEVPFISHVPTGRETSDIYLKHPGNESSDDEEGNEEQIICPGDDEIEEINFNDFLKKRKDQQMSKKKSE